MIKQSYDTTLKLICFAFYEYASMQQQNAVGELLQYSNYNDVYKMKNT